MNFNPKNNLIISVRHGSWAYGLNDENSDIDLKSICMEPFDSICSFINNFEQLEEHQSKGYDTDHTIFGLKKFLPLATANNPNCIEILFVEKEDLLFTNKYGEKLIEIRDKFLSKKSFWTFQGYAKNQLKRIEGHRKWILNPPSAPISRVEFGLPEKSVINEDQKKAALSAIQKKIDFWNFKDMSEQDKSLRIEFSLVMADILAEMKMGQDEQWKAAGLLLNFDTNFLDVLDKERRYKNLLENYQNFLIWQRDRNKKRYELEIKCNVDCYSDDTEFLTKNGWKKFDEINEIGKLATIYPPWGKSKFRKPQGIEYQNYTDKFDSIYNGNMYELNGNHLSVYVSANHKMLIRKRERKNQKLSEWELTEVAHLPDTFDILQKIKPNEKNYSENIYFSEIDEVIDRNDFIKLIGWYLTDGSAQNKSIRISQKKFGKLYDEMIIFYNKYKNICSFFEQERAPNEWNSHTIIECSLDVKGVVAQKIINDCGSVKEKRIPRWCYELGIKSLKTLIHAMNLGDGTFKKDSKYQFWVYYSSLEGLADDFQELCFLAGYLSDKYGPYEQTIKYNGKKYVINMWQVSCYEELDEYKTLIRASNVEKRYVSNQRIVCFTVPNGILITRRNGHIAIHGNCKHSSHLIRLYFECIDILKGNGLILKRPKEERQILLDIKQGKFGKQTYDEVMKLQVELEKKANEALINSKLPQEADIKFIDNFMRELYLEYWYENGEI